MAHKFTTADSIAGGKARSKELTPKRRREIAIKAAETRWKDKQPKPAGRKSAA